MERMIILFNPSSDQGRASGRCGGLRTALDQAGLEYKLVVTQSEGHLRRLARDAGRYYSLVVGAGGDSTFSIIAGEIRAARTGAVLGLIPLGSSNDIPREFGLERLDMALAALKEGRVRDIDLGYVKAGEHPLGCFLGQANAGLGAFVNRRVAARSGRRRRRIKRQFWAGFWATRRVLRAGDVPLHLKITGEGETFDGLLTAAVFSNIRYFATGKTIAPEARPDDGILDACLIGPCSWAGLGKIHRLAREGRHGRLPHIESLRAPAFKIQSKIPFEIQADGEILGTNDGRTKFDDFEIGILPKALKLIG